MKKIFSSLSVIDLFQRDITLYFKGSKNFNTVIGGIMTLIILGLLILYLIIQINQLIDKENPTFYTHLINLPTIEFKISNSTEIPNTKESKYDLPFMLSVGFRNGNLQLIDDSIVNITAYQYEYFQKNNTLMKTPLLLEPCQSFLDISQESIDNLDLVNTYCLNSTYKLSYNFASQINFNYVQISVSKCKNSTEFGSASALCSSQEEIDSYFTDYNLELFYYNQNINFTSASNPVTKDIRQLYYYRLDGFYKHDVFKLNLKFFESYEDDSPSFFSTPTIDSKVSQLNRANSYLREDIDNNQIALLSFYTEENITTYKRYYTDYLTILANCGGLSTLLFISGYLLITFFVDTTFSMSIKNKLFSVMKKDTVNKGFDYYIKAKFNYSYGLGLKRQLNLLDYNELINFIDSQKNEDEESSEECLSKSIDDIHDKSSRVKSVRMKDINLTMKELFTKNKKDKNDKNKGVNNNVDNEIILHYDIRRCLIKYLLMKDLHNRTLPSDVQNSNNNKSPKIRRSKVLIIKDNYDIDNQKNFILKKLSEYFSDNRIESIYNLENETYSNKCEFLESFICLCDPEISQNLEEFYNAKNESEKRKIIENLKTCKFTEIDYFSYFFNNTPLNHTNYYISLMMYLFFSLKCKIRGLEIKEFSYKFTPMEEITDTIIRKGIRKDLENNNLNNLVNLNNKDDEKNELKNKNGKNDNKSEDSQVEKEDNEDYNNKDGKPDNNRINQDNTGIHKRKYFDDSDEYSKGNLKTALNNLSSYYMDINKIVFNLEKFKKFKQCYLDEYQKDLFDTISKPILHFKQLSDLNFSKNMKNKDKSNKDIDDNEKDFYKNISDKDKYCADLISKKSEILKSLEIRNINSISNNEVKNDNKKYSIDDLCNNIVSIPDLNVQRKFVTYIHENKSIDVFNEKDIDRIKH